MQRSITNMGDIARRLCEKHLVLIIIVSTVFVWPEAFIMYVSKLRPVHLQNIYAMLDTFPDRFNR